MKELKEYAEKLFEDIKYMFVTFVDDDENNNGITFMITLNTGEVSVV